MIYFVDEDMGEFSPFAVALRMQGLEVQTLPDATAALTELSLASEAQLVFLDVMLARGLDPGCHFTEAGTRRGLQTGLRLLELLMERNAACFPSRAVLLSNATDGELVKTIESHGRQHRVEYWKKTEFRTTSDFVGRVRTHLALKGG